ncbi:MAG: hypothetical protein KDD61_00905 [Bdellovibrionales bacterium]|nr:hypothetical protein [Bdellovibrionales bacterium]
MKQVQFQRVMVKYGKYILPSLLRKKFYSRSFKFPRPLDKEITISVAESSEDFKAAFALIYSEYLRLGYIKKDDIRMYYKLHHLLPESTLIVAKKQGQVIGTISLIRDNEFGLPLESCFALSENRKESARNKRLVEICSFVIDRSYRRTGGTDLSIYMFKYLYEYAAQFMQAGLLFIAITPHHFDFYRFLFGFKKWSPKIKNYMGAPAMNCYLDVPKASQFLMRSKSCQEGNNECFSEFFLNKKCTNFIFPERVFHKITDNNMSLFEIKFFLRKKPEIVSDLTENQIRALYLKFGYKKAKKILPKLLKVPSYLKRETRFEVECLAKWEERESNIRAIQTAKVSNVSSSGLYIQKQLVERDTLKMRISVGSNLMAQLQVKVIHSCEEGSRLQIVDSSKEWSQFISYLSSQHINTARQRMS